MYRNVFGQYFVKTFKPTYVAWTVPCSYTPSLILQTPSNRHAQSIYTSILIHTRFLTHKHPTVAYVIDTPFSFNYNPRIHGMTLHTRNAHLNIPTHIVYSGTTVNYTPILLCLHIYIRDYVFTYPRQYPPTHSCIRLIPLEAVVHFSV